MHRFLSTLLDALIPPHQDVALARGLSEKDIAELMSPRQAGAPWISALFPYREARIRALIRAIKYRGETRALQRVGNALGEYVLEVIGEKELMSGWEHPILTPIPSSERRLRERGYNQAARIALSAIAIIGEATEYDTEILSREERESQVSVERAKRSENIRNAFSVPNPKKVSGRFVILIDDVVESGATLADARRALLEAGATDVIAIALAH